MSFGVTFTNDQLQALIVFGSVCGRIPGEQPGNLVLKEACLRLLKNNPKIVSYFAFVNKTAQRITQESVGFLVATIVSNAIDVARFSGNAAQAQRLKERREETGGEWRWYSRLCGACSSY